MARSVELLQTRERMRVGHHFLTLRPKLAAAGALGNGMCMIAADVPAAQRLWLGLALGSTVCAFFVEAWWLRRHALTERFLLCSLSLTLLAIATGTLLSGGLQSPLLPIAFAPVVVGFAAFARSSASSFLFLLTVLVLGLVLLIAPLPGFGALPAPWLSRMLWISTVVSLALLATGVTGLVDAHARVSMELERMRSDMLKEAERRASSLENLGAQVAHEVKNPLTAVRGLAQLVERKSEDPRDKQRLSVVIAEVDRALSVLQDYLSLSRPLSDLSLAQTEILPLLADVKGVLEARAHERKVHIEIQGHDLQALVDRQRLRDALLNLALNAISAMPEGGVLRLCADTRTDAASNEVLRIVVADQGIGMNEAQLARLGSAFASETEGGTGLGVLIARSVAAQHGGTLSFESEVGRGTRALLELPYFSPAKCLAMPVK